MDIQHNQIPQDGEIIDLLFARSEQGLGQIQGKYGKALLQMARNIVKNEQDAEECVNDTLVKIWESIPPNRPGSLLAYALTIVRNLSLNKLQFRNAEKRGGSVVCIPFSELEEHLEGIAVPDESKSQEFQRIINDFLDSLSQKDAVLFVRRYWYLDSIKTLSEMSGYSENNVYQKLFVMRRKLRERLIKEGYCDEV
ncbi:MAG: sigma-70 family RNA polymerase sigma factor [Clostridia bacterium]|nr:sigma-70 family RNA polymerase sigma factor [Clostridia bacterium]